MIIQDQKKKNNKERKLLRLKNYDYSSVGYYFVTICVQNKRCLFGKIQSEHMILNTYGNIVKKSWDKLPQMFADIALDEFIVMPNHVHGIIQIVGAAFMTPNNVLQFETQGAINRAPTLGEIVRAFKASSCRFIHLSGLNNFKWQRNYYERVIRNDIELNEIRRYIADNPINWNIDPDNIMV
jgi:REP element-mobilizing transposase RayT